MNQLRRMVLVNSANVRYREIELDGHIHFIGTQGTGKSTLLRAILFFYNADGRKLGISREKKAFADYYFPFADSYIFYEVQVGARRFCVWLYKRQNRLCFRFIDGAYSPELVIDGSAARGEAEVLAKAAELGFKVERPVYKFTQYRDILYGADRSMRRYALMHNPSYSTIPRTVSNIFLNANLDGDYIKKTIIDSLSEEAVEINLEANRHHLETARSHYADVTTFLQNESTAERIVAEHAAVLELEVKEREAAWKIGAAYNRARERVLKLEAECAADTQAEQEQRTKLTQLKAQFKTEQDRLQNRLSVVKDNIVRANRLTREYAQKNIDALMAEAGKAPEYRREKEQLEQQRRLLTSELQLQEQQFSLAQEQLKHQAEVQVREARSELGELKDRMRDAEDTARSAFEAERNELEQRFTEQIEPHQTELTEVKSRLIELNFELRAMDRMPMFENERSALLEDQQALEQSKIRSEEAGKSARRQEKELSREAEDKQRLEEAAGEKRLAPLLVQRENKLAQRDRLRAELEQLAGSLLDYLEREVPDWGATIGRVARRDLLLDTRLEPMTGEGHSLYGVDLQLGHLESETLSRAVIEKELKDTEQALISLSKQIDQQVQQNQAEQDKLIQHYNRKVREQKELAKQEENNLFTLERDLEKNAIALHELQERAAAEKAVRINELEQRRSRLQIQEEELAVLIEQRTAQQATALQTLENDFRRKCNGFFKPVKEREKAVDRIVAEQEAWLAERQEALQADWAEQLRQKGVDADKVADLEHQIALMNQKLEAIEVSRETIYGYEKDRREWMDRLEEFQRERKRLEDDIEHRNQLNQRRIRQENEALQVILNRLTALRQERNAVDAERAAFKAFQPEELFRDYEAYIQHHDRSDGVECIRWIGTLKSLALEFDKKDRILRDRITAFAGRFSENNCLDFEVRLAGDTAFRSFAEHLTAFIREQRIVTLKTEVTKKYSMVLDGIVRDTTQLLKKEGEVQGIIRKINDDFRKSNFVGVVRSIEMRLQESSDRIFQVLRAICIFQTEHALNFGELNLFNQGGNSNDEKAVELLEQLLAQMGQMKSKVLRLEDALDLEFRVCENENDTNWVSRLANVGSNGTDVLVKSMIYINLLNIFKSGGRKNAESTMLHCLVDEVGILHDSNVTSLINFAAARGICMINGSPNSHNEQDYRHIYIFRKEGNQTAITRLVSHVA
ncbi:ATP-binding protein [Pontiellaceae bacterium B12219]|nr:ATP-binding protein [Pontiellaceae bacterium B12219]